MASDDILMRIVEKIQEATELGRPPTYILVGKKEIEEIKRKINLEWLQEDEDIAYFLFGCEVLITHKSSLLDVI